jgi:hypothetical protein
LAPSLPPTVLFGRSPEKPTTVILGAFLRGFARGIQGANVTFRLRRALSGAIVGLLASLPEAIAVTVGANPGQRPRVASSAWVATETLDNLT